MEVTPGIRTARGANVPYADYLQTAHWRSVRDQALRRAKWRCEQCQTKRELQVHHRTYERLGQEAPGDLVVLCAGCHENEHPQEFEHDYLRHYMKLAEDVIATDRRFESVVDFSEALKRRCAKAKVPYNTDKLARAIRAVFAKHPNLIVQPAVERMVRESLPAHEGPSAHEARQLLRKIGFAGVVKQMPDAQPLPRVKRDRLKALTMVMEEFAEAESRCEALERAVEK